MLCIGVNPDNTLYVLGNAPCAESGLVAMTLLELQGETASPWRLSLAEGGLIAGAILGVWAAAWCFRSLRSVLNSGDVE